MDDRSQISGRTSTKKSLSEIQVWIDRLNSLLDGPEASMRLAGLGTLAVAPLRQFLLSGVPSGIFQPRQWAVEALATLGAKDALLEYLKRDDPIPDPVIRQGEEAVRNTAARLVARWKTEDVFQILLSLADKRLLPGVISSLGEFGRAEALPRLERALEDDVARPAAEEAFLKFGEPATDRLVSTVTRQKIIENQEVPSSLQRRRSAAKILADTGLGEPFWPKLQPLLDESDPELVVHAARLAVRAGDESDKQRAVIALLRILPEAPWHVREDAASCLKALLYLGEKLIDEEIARRLSQSPQQRAADKALIMLARIRSQVQVHR